MIDPITFTGFNWTAHKISLYLTAFLDQNPAPSEELRLRAAVPYDASTIQITDEYNPFFHILSHWKAVEFC